MHQANQPKAKFKVAAVCTVSDPAERQRRLAQVYGLIMELSRQKRVAAQAEPDTTPSATD